MEVRVPAVQKFVPPLKIIYGKVKADSQFSLHYLRKVDTVIDAVTNLRNNAQITEQVISEGLKQIEKSGDSEIPIDPKQSFASISISAESVVKKTINALKGIEKNAMNSEFTASDADTMVESSQEAIGALERLHDSMVDLRWAIMEHDADLEEPESETFEKIENLTAALKHS